MGRLINTNWKKWFSLIVAGTIVLSIYAACSQLLPQLKTTWIAIDWSKLALGVALVTCYRLLNANGWAMVIRTLGGQLNGAVAMRIWLRTEACRWLPGSLWNLGSRAVVAGQAGVPKSIATASVLLELLLTITAWLVACLLGLAVYGMGTTELLSHLRLDILAITALIGLGIVTAASSWLRFTTAGRNKFARLRETLVAIQTLRPSVRGAATVATYYTVLCILNGLALACIIWAFQPEIMPPLLAVVGINALAWLVGFFAIFAPGGVVIREGCIAGLLLPWLPDTTAISVAVVWRLLQIGVEVLCLAATYFPAAWVPFSSTSRNPSSKLLGALAE